MTAYTQTICEHLRWRTPTGGNRVAAALGLLERLERAGILTLPAKRAHKMRPGPRKPVALIPRTAPQPLIEDRLRDLLPLRLQLAAPEQTGLWNEFVERHHYLGYEQPAGPASALLPARPPRTPAGLPAVQPGDTLAALPRRLGGLAAGRLQEASGPRRRPAPLSAVPLGARPLPGV